jgi:prophage regulatory protein
MDIKKRAARIEQAHPKGYMRQHELLKLVPFSAATLWRKSRNGTFPPAIKLSDRVTCWKREAVEAWLAAKEAV